MRNRNKKTLFIVHCSLFIILLLSSCENMFQNKIPKSDKNGTLDDFFYRNVDEITKLSTPTQFYVAPYYSSSDIRLTWNEVRGAAYYMVERAVAARIPNTQTWEEPNAGDYEPLNRFVYSTYYVDEILKNPAPNSPEFNNKYYYRISAYNTSRNYEESEPTSPQSAMLFYMPNSIKATGGVSEEHIMVTWDPVPGADSYEIVRSRQEDGSSASTLATVRGSQTTWYRNVVNETEQGVDFYYMITAKNSFGNKTPQVGPAYGYSKVFGAPEAPENVRFSPEEYSGRGYSKTEITIKWDAVAEPEAYYAVYRYSSIDSSLKKLKDKLDDVTYTDVGLTPGIFYYYKVQAIFDDIAGNPLKSQFSSPDLEGFLLSCPDDVLAEKSSDGTVTVKWKPAMGTEGERAQYTYKVYAGNTMEGDLSNVVAPSIPSSVGADGYISATGLPQSYTFFRVTTVNPNAPNGQLESNQSILVSPSPAAAIIQDASRYANIPGVNANANEVYPVQITWKKPEGEDPAFYNVQRSTRSTDGFSKINDEPLSANSPGSSVFYRDPITGVYTYIDKNETARVGRKYYYRVLSLNQLGQGSFPSDEKIGWGALTYDQYIVEYGKTMNSALKKLTLMYKSVATDKLGNETKYGSISGSIYYNATLSGTNARIIIQLSNYADFRDESGDVYFTLTGNSNTSANMSSNGSMDGTVTCTGMYPGSVRYNNVEIKGGAAGGGTYGVEPNGFPRSELRFDKMPK